MCGRFSQYEEFSELALRFMVGPLNEDWSDPAFLKPSYNIAPGQKVPIVLNDRVKQLRPMTWGLVPSWVKEQSVGNKMINARAETLAERASFKDLINRRRCIVPATGFYEWAKEGKRKVPMHFRLKSGELFGFAGLWDSWKSPGGDFESFTIITTEPNELLARVHNRMPVILRREYEDRWLDPRISNFTALQPILKPYPAEAMEGYEVSILVNSPANDAPECIQEAT